MNPSLALSTGIIRSRRTRLFQIGGVLLALGLASLGGGAVYVFSTQPTQVAVTDSSGVAQFNFRVTGIPVPGVVPGVVVEAAWNPAQLERSSATVSVNLEKLDTGIALRDEHARNFLGVAQHPQATFVLEGIQGVGSLKVGQQAEGIAKGIFSLNGVEKALEAPTKLSLNAQGSTLEVTTRFDVVLRDHKISIPGADPKTEVAVKFRLPTQP